MTADAEDAEARRRIAEDLECTFVVEAAAGTGKTTSLVERVLSAIGSGVDMGSIVAVTFTDKAAGELRLRIRAGLERRRQEDGSRSELYRRALARLEEAHVSTIHRFAGDLLRLRPVEAGVDPQFSPLSPAEARALFHEAFGGWFESALARPSNALRRALRRHDASVDKLRRSVFRLIEHRHLDAPWTRREVDVVAEGRALLRRIEALAERSSVARSRSDRLYGALTPIREVARRGARLDDERLEAELVELAHRTWETSYGGGQYGPGVDRTELVRTFAELRAALAEFASRASAHLAVELRDDLMGAVHDYDALKAKRGALDFDDLVLRARDVMLTDAALLAGIRRRLTHFFVDEFQDTDPVQAGLLLLLASEGEHHGDPFRSRIARGRLFVVGDPKQSIYRFRHADPGTYALVRRLVIDSGGEVLELGVSFRSTPSILGFVNAAFQGVMDGDPTSQQAHYVALRPHRPQRSGEPSVIALPIPRPYGTRRLARYAMRESYPNAMAAFVAWLVKDSGRTVLDPATKARVPIAPRHIAILYRQFESYGKSAPEPLSQGLDARGIPHVILGSGHLGGRDEAHALTTALTAIEHPDDALFVYATLHGLLFGLTDETLFEWITRYGPLRATNLPKTAIPASLVDVLEALLLLSHLHRRRNARTAAETVARLLEATRAEVGFALTPSAAQAFLQVAAVEQVAAAHELGGGLSFGAFVEALAGRDQDRASAIEDTSDDDAAGVRIMTVHRAKGLEFPVVIIADPTEGAARPPDKLVDVERRLGALSLMGCAPWDLLDAHETEKKRCVAEGARIAYVAATRARDLLVVPVVGDDPKFPADGWTAPLGAALVLAGWPVLDGGQPRRPRVTGPDLVLNRPLDMERPAASLAAGVHETLGGDVAFLDPRELSAASANAQGVQEVDFLSRDVDPALLAADIARWEPATSKRQRVVEAGARPSHVVETVTKRSKGEPGAAPVSRRVSRLSVTREPGRPTGKRFGSLVHLVLATVPLSSGPDVVLDVARSVSRLIYGVKPLEAEAAARAAMAALGHPLFDRARRAAERGRMQREVPIMLAMGKSADGVQQIADGIIDLTFEDDEGLCIVDYKTDDPTLVGPDFLAAYEAQIDLYARAMEQVSGRSGDAVLLFV